MDSPSLSEALAEFTAGMRLEQLPTQVVDHARLLLLDALGAALAGAGTAEATSMAEAVRTCAGDGGPSAIWGTGRRTSRAGAALANGTAAHAQELDDFGGCDHSGAVVVPAILAAAEGMAVGGDRFLTAMVAGYDVALRVLAAAGGYGQHNGRGWHSTGTCGSFGAAAAVSAVLGLDPQRTAWALGLAGSFTGGLWAFLEDGAMSKRYHPGRAAETGLLSAHLAAAGFTGPRRVLEAEWGGFLSTYAGTAAAPERITDGLGAEFGILRSGVKPYACCRGAHGAIDVVLDLLRSGAVRAGDVARVRVRCSPANVRLLGDGEPRTRLAAQMSLPYSVGVALVAGRASLAEYEDRRLSDPTVRAATDRVTLEADESVADAEEPYVTVETCDGRTLTGHVDVARGAPENPLSPGEIVAKYEELAGRALSRASVADVREAALAIELPGAPKRLLRALAGRDRPRPAVFR